MASINSISAAYTVFKLNEFSTTLFKGIREPGNVVVSPFSVAAVLTMAYTGAKHNTAYQIKNGLNFNQNSDKEFLTKVGELLISAKNCDVDIANQVYLADHYKLPAALKALLKQHFGIPPEQVNFKDEQTHLDINKWVEDSTHKKIKNYLSTGSLMSAFYGMLLVNAVYFKGIWLNRFEKALTTLEPFYPSSNQEVQANMMHLKDDFRSNYVKELNARILVLPFVGNKISMFIVLPDNIDGLPAVEEKMDGFLVKKIYDHSISYASKVSISIEIPKFKMECDFQMQEPLVNIGMCDMFEEEADFSGFSRQRNGLRVSKIFQKCVFEVNEEGAEAIAVTGFSSDELCLSVDEVEPFVANHPFLYFISDNVTKTILFIGRVVDPNSDLKSNVVAGPRRSERIAALAKKKAAQSGN